MAQLNFDASTVTPDAGFQPMPVDWYDLMVTASELKPTNGEKGPGLRLAVEITVQSGKFAGRKIFTGFNLQNPNEEAVKISRAQLSALAHAVGVLQVQDSQQLHGIPFKGRIKVRPAKGDYDASNEITTYKPASDPQPTNTASDASGIVGGAAPNNMGGAAPTWMNQQAPAGNGQAAPAGFGLQPQGQQQPVQQQQPQTMQAQPAQQPAQQAAAPAQGGMPAQPWQDGQPVQAQAAQAQQAQQPAIPDNPVVQQAQQAQPGFIAQGTQQLAQPSVQAAAAPAQGVAAPAGNTPSWAQ